MAKNKISKEVSSTSNPYEDIEKPEVKGLRRILCLTIVMCGMFFNGVVYGFPSPAELSFYKDLEINNEFDRLFPNDLKLTSKETNYFASFSQIGFPVGGLLCGVMVTLIGKRLSSLFGLALSYVVGHSLILLASNVEMLYAGRIFSCICCGFCNSLNYIYVLDFCLNFKEKAICGVIMSLIGNFGTLIVYIFGIFLNWRQLAMVCVLCGVPYILGLIVVLPNDCPSWKLSSNRKISLTKTKLIGEESDLTQSFWRDLKKHLKILLICKSLWICLLMMFFYQFAGYTLVVSFAGKLLKQECTHLLDSTSNLTNNEMNPSIIPIEFLASLDPALLSACLVAIAGLIGVILGVILVQISFDRRKILLGSAFGTVVTFAALGIYNMTTIIDPKDIPLIPTICLVLHVLLFNVGYGPLCYALMAEILPSHIRTLKMSIIMIFGGLFGFLNLKSFSFLENYLENGPIYLIYAGVNLIGFIYLQLFLPNTDQLQ